MFARVRERGIKGDPSLAYFEFSAEGDDPESLDEEDLDDEENWAQANPGLGIRITPEHIAKERRSMDPRTFAVERLGVGDWPRTDGLDGVVIAPEIWAERADRKSKVLDPVCFAVDVTPDRSRGSIAAAGVRDDGRLHVEMIERRSNGNGIIEYVRERMERHAIIAVMIDGRSPANSLREGLTDKLSIGALRQNEITVMSSTQHAEACGMFADAVKQQRLRHLGQREMLEALRGATKRSLTDAWAWNRKDSSVDISPLVACTLALWGSEVFREGVPRVWSF